MSSPIGQTSSLKSDWRERILEGDQLLIATVLTLGKKLATIPISQDEKVAIAKIRGEIFLLIEKLIPLIERNLGMELKLFWEKINRYYPQLATMATINKIESWKNNHFDQLDQAFKSPKTCFNLIRFLLKDPSNTKWSLKPGANQIPRKQMTPYDMQQILSTPWMNFFTSQEAIYTLGAQTAWALASIGEIYQLLIQDPLLKGNFTTFLKQSISLILVEGAPILKTALQGRHPLGEMLCDQLLSSDKKSEAIQALLEVFLIEK